MHKVRNFCIIIAAVIVAAVLFLSISLLFKKPQMSIDFTVTDVTGNTFSLHDNIGKTPTVLVFFDMENEDSSHVLECVAKLDSVDIIAISKEELSESELPESVVGLQKLCLDGKAAISAYKISQAPVTYFIDKDGYVQDVFIGKFKEETANKACDKISGE